MMQRIYFRLNWRDYFRVSKEQLKKLKKEDGISVYQKLYRDTISSFNKNLKESLIAIDENTRTVISVPNTDYEEVLTLCQSYLEQNEDYESCAEIRDTMVKLKSKRGKRKRKEIEKLLLIKRD